jgi:isopentenyldiphosphate isomerase
LIESTLLRCTDENGDPTFVKERWTNDVGVVTAVLRLSMDTQTHKEWNDSGGEFDRTELFRKRTAAFDRVTNHLISSGVISRKHDDVYPICPFLKPSASDTGGGGGSAHGKKVVLAHVNRNAAPYLGVDSVGVHLHCYVCHEECGPGGSGGIPASRPRITGVWLAKRAAAKAHYPGYWDPTVAGGQPANLSLVENVIKEAQEEAGVPAEWIAPGEAREAPTTPTTLFSDHTGDPLTIATAKPDGTCLKNSCYYSCDLRVPCAWTPVPVDGEVSEFRLYSMEELEEEVRRGNRVRPAMRAVLLDFMLRHGRLKGGGGEDLEELRGAMRRKRLLLWP